MYDFYFVYVTTVIMVTYIEMLKNKLELLIDIEGSDLVAYTIGTVIGL